MKIAILGGGLTGLTAAYDLAKKGHSVSLYEKEDGLGGLARGYKNEGWEWYLEKTIHHLFSNDKDILNFAEEIGFKSIFFQKPETSSLYKNSNSLRVPNSEFRIYPLDSPVDLLRFPLLGLIDKLRVGLVLAFLKISPPLPVFEKMTAEDFLRKTMGKKAWEVLWQELFRKKFGKYAGNIVASWIWSRVNKRTQKLGYINGGFQTFIEHVEAENVKQGVKFKKGKGIDAITKRGKNYIVDGEVFDVVISTLPTQTLAFVGKKIFPTTYLKRFAKLHYLWAQVLIIETDKPLLKKSYWLNICIPSFPITVLVQHTNFVSKRHYGDKHLLYVGNYLEDDSPLLKMSDRTLFNHFKPYLQAIGPKGALQKPKVYRFQAPYAQPIFDKEFLENKPDFITPAKNFYIANLDMTYPHDRGTNYAVKLGREVAELVLNRVLK